MAYEGSKVEVATLKSSRDSSIELLRIISACAVIILHYNGGAGKALAYSSGTSHDILIFLECLSVCAVDVFIMISGYFLCTTTKRTWDKPVYLVLLMWIISLLSYSAGIIINCGGGVRLSSILQRIFPPSNYFVILYISLYVISPFINLSLNKLTAKGRMIMIMVFLFLFSIYPTILDGYQLLVHHEYMGISPVGAWGQQHGYTIVGFSLCYCIGAWIKLNDIKNKLKIGKIIGLTILIVFGIYVWYSVEYSMVLHESNELINYNAFSYSNPLVVLLASLLLLLFSKLNIKSKLINSFSRAAFVCYIFHLIVLPYLRIGFYAQKGGAILLLHLVSSILVIYIFSWLLWRILDLLIKPVMKSLNNKVIYKVHEDGVF